jgi:hypothetical protein
LLRQKVRKKRASETQKGCGFQIDAMIFWTPRARLTRLEKALVR